MSMNKQKKKKWRVIIVLLIVFVAVLVAAVAVFVWQKNNIEAVKLYMSQSREDIENQLSENDAYVNELLESILNDALGGETGLADETFEITESEPDGTHTAEDTEIKAETTAPYEPPTDTEVEGGENIPETLPVVKVESEKTLTEDTAPATEADTTAVTESETKKVSEETTVDMSAYAAELQALVDKVKKLREEYVGELDKLYAEGVAAYKAIPKAERTTKKIATLVSEYISKGTALERECDGKMDSLVKEFRALLKKYGQSTDIINEVKLAYAREKSLKKALYMSELERRGYI